MSFSVLTFGSCNSSCENNALEIDRAPFLPELHLSSSAFSLIRLQIISSPPKIDEENRDGSLININNSFKANENTIGKSELTELVDFDNKKNKEM